MLKTDNIDTYGWEAAIRGMRNPLNSWQQSDSVFIDAGGDYHTICGDTGPYGGSPSYESQGFELGDKDLTLMQKLAHAGPDHGKFLRMIYISLDVTAPMYWWKEFDTYRVGMCPNPTDVEYNSTSTMHKIMHKKFGREDFSTEHLCPKMLEALDMTIDRMNVARDLWLYNAGDLVDRTKSKVWWWQVIQLLPSSYNYLRTVTLNYAAARNIYHARRNHKLDEWHQFCDMLEQLPYAKELIVE